MAEEWRGSAEASDCSSQSKELLPLLGAAQRGGREEGKRKGDASARHKLADGAPCLMWLPVGTQRYGSRAAQPGDRQPNIRLPGTAARVHTQERKNKGKQAPTWVLIRHKLRRRLAAQVLPINAGKEGVTP